MLLASFLWPGALWSVSWWSSVSLPLAVILSLLSLPTLIPFRSLPSRKDASGLGTRRGIILVIILAALAVLMWLLRNDHPVYGGIREASGYIEGDSPFSSPYPVPETVGRLLYGLLNGTILMDSGSSLAVLSLLAGLFFIVSAWSFTGKYRHSDTGSRIIATALVLSGGVLPLFFGEGFPAVAALFVFLYMKTIISFKEREGSYLILSLLLFLSLFSHPAAVFLLPGFIFIIIKGLFSERERWEASKGLLLLALLWAGGETFLRSVPGSGSPTSVMIAILVSFTKGPGAGEQILNILNGFLVMGPSVIVSLLLLFTSDRRAGVKEKIQDSGDDDRSSGKTDIAMKVTVLSAMIVIATGNSLAENGLRWAFFSVAAPVFILFVLDRLLRLEKRRFRSAAILICAAGLIHAASVIVTNTSTESAEKRLLSLRLPGGEAEYAIAGAAYEDLQIDKAKRYYSIATEKDPGNAEAFFRLGRIYLDEEDYYKAVSLSAKALELRPENDEFRFGLARAYLKAEWYRDAVPYLRKLTERHPDNAIYWSRLGQALNYSRNFSEAIGAYEKALRLEVDNEDYKIDLSAAMINMASELHAAGETSRAVEMIGRAIALVPYRSYGYNRLAAIEMAQGEHEKALGTLQAALKNCTTIDFRTYLYLGLVMDKLGRYEEAVEYLEKSREINPMSDADAHLRRIYKEHIKKK